MSRAFTRENNGWSYCIKEHEECMFADNTGKCALSKCIKETEKKDSPKQ